VASAGAATSAEPPAVVAVSAEDVALVVAEDVALVVAEATVAATGKKSADCDLDRPKDQGTESASQSVQGWGSVFDCPEQD
jgi:hypothetical protein